MGSICIRARFHMWMEQRQRNVCGGCERQLAKSTSQKSEDKKIYKENAPVTCENVT